MITAMEVPAVCLNCRWCRGVLPNRGDEYDTGLPLVCTCTCMPEWHRVMDAQAHWCSHYQQADQPQFLIPGESEERGGEDVQDSATDDR